MKHRDLLKKAVKTKGHIKRLETILTKPLRKIPVRNANIDRRLVRDAMRTKSCIEFIYLYIYTFIHLCIYTFIHLHIYTFIHLCPRSARSADRRQKACGRGC